MDKRHKLLILIGVSLACFLCNLDFTIVSTALPAIQKDLVASLLQLQWVMNVFVLVVSMLMIAMGRFGDVFGTKPLLLFGILIFGLASLFAATAPNPAVLIIARALQGIGSAIIIPCSLAIIAKTFPTSESGRAVGIWTAINSAGLAIGPVTGGLIISILSWRYIFYINVPVVIISFILCWKYLVKEKQTHLIKEIDWLGLILLNVTIGALIVPIIQITDWGFDSSITLSLLFTSAFALLAFIYVETHVANPIMKFKVLANRKFIAGTTSNFCLVGIIWVIFFLFPLYLHNIRNEIVFVVGIMLVAISSTVVLVSPIAGQLVDKVGAKKIILTGLCLLLVSLLIASTFQPLSAAWYVIACFIILGIGWAFVMGPSASMAVTSVSEKYAGLSSGSLWSIQNIGGALSLAIAGSLFISREHIQLSTHLQQHAINLSREQTTVIHSLLSNPENIKQALSHLTVTQGETVIHLFQNSFIYGFSAAMLFLVGLTLAAIASVFWLLRNKSVSVPDKAS